MRTIPNLDAAERRSLFEQTSAQMGVTPVIAEKDFWVSWTLERLFTNKSLPRLLFKGGTSLSKGFQMIERFSEDIDLGMDRGDIGIPNGDVPSADMTPSGRKKARKSFQFSKR